MFFNRLSASCRATEQKKAVSYILEGKDIWWFFQLGLEKSLIYQSFVLANEGGRINASLVVLLADRLAG